MQPDTDLCKIVIVLLTQNIDNMLLIVVPSGIRTLHGEINNVLRQFSAARQQLLNSDYRGK